MKSFPQACIFQHPQYLLSTVVPQMYPSEHPWAITSKIGHKGAFPSSLPSPTRKLYTLQQNASPVISKHPPRQLPNLNVFLRLPSVTQILLPLSLSNSFSRTQQHLLIFCKIIKRWNWAKQSPWVLAQARRVCFHSCVSFHHFATNYKLTKKDEM